MKRTLLCFLTVLFSAGIAYAGQMIEVSPQVQAYWATAENVQVSEQKSPTIILIHEWWGLNDHIKDLANRFAAQGFNALAIDLYRGHATQDAGEAHELMRGLPDDRAVKDLQAALDFLSRQAPVHPERMGVIGWCMGGGYALKLATEDSRVAAVAMYYGKLITEDASLRSMKAPLLGIFGAKDRGIPADSVEDFKHRLERLGKRAEIYLYPEAGHAFANPQNEGYRKDDAMDAWEKTLIFFKANLS